MNLHLPVASDDKSLAPTHFDPHAHLRRIPNDGRYAVVAEYQTTCPSMVGVIRIRADDPADAWERHDAGDELLVVLSGRVTMEVRLRSGSLQSFGLGAGEVLLVPANTPHSGRAVTPEAEVLFVTPRRGNHEWSEEA